MRRSTALLVWLAPLVLCAGLLGGCGKGSASGSEPDDGSPAMIEVSIRGDDVEPSGQRLDVAAGQEVDLVVKSDREGEIHVHSDPEHEYEYEPGTTTFSFSVDRPGVVDVELHEPEQLLAQLEVR